MGTRGPVPKRSIERRRTNRPGEHEPDLTSAPLGPVEIPEPDEDWEPIAHNWYVGLMTSGQNKFYAQSDWDFAYLLAEEMHRLLAPRFVGMADRWNREAQQMERLPVMLRQPLAGGELSALIKGFTDLLITEASRRRLRIELSNDEEKKPELSAGQQAAARARERLSQGHLTAVPS